MNDIDKLNKRVDGAAQHYNRLDARLAEEARYYAKLAKRVAQLEREADKTAAYQQEYGAGRSGQFAPVTTVTTLSVTDKEMHAAAKTFVRSIGKLNRYYLKQALVSSKDRGDATRALEVALSLYPSAR